MRRFLIATLLCLSANGAAALACQIPVFRYALERWQPDPYEVLVFHRGELSKADRSLLEKLRKASIESNAPGAGFANIRVSVIDLDGEVPEELASHVEGLEGTKLPALVVHYPLIFGPGPPLWFGSLSDDAIASLVDSPARRTIADRLTGGDSVVWVLIESGDKAADDKAFQTLEKNLKRLEKELKLPEMEEILADEEYQPGVKVELKLKFSAVRVGRDDAAERMLVAMLMGIEDDLKEFKDKPIAIPVFGRGRALYGLTGPGINADTIGEACEALIGPCSCTVKDLNPGVDLVFSIDWNSRIIGDAAPPRPLPELPGLAALDGASSEDDEVGGDTVTTAVSSEEVGEEPRGDTPAGDVRAGETAEDTETVIRPVSEMPSAGDEEESGLVLAIVLVSLLGLSIVVIGSAVMLRSKQRS